MDKIISGWSSLNQGKLATLIIGLLFFKSFSFAQTTTTAILGTWLNEEKAAKIEIYWRIRSMLTPFVAPDSGK